MHVGKYAWRLDGALARRKAHGHEKNIAPHRLGFPTPGVLVQRGARDNCAATTDTTLQYRAASYTKTFIKSCAIILILFTKLLNIDDNDIILSDIG